ncbi:probable salivary secreted peptide [Trichogramma pretiosum]|uniref:probable salivary secreted peptide n=1 Tax=Trichogramma pretiosum TaxID=7493 RepID=UPI0006C9AACE|nr:probable salivary secreted peptide [Trichogramma pretiosum]
MSLKLVLLCLAALAALAQSQSHDLVIGERQYNDILVYSENIALQASVVGQKIVHEQTFNAINNHVITQVVAKDSADDGTGATVTVTGGGPGQDHITLRFKSQRFRGVYFTVQVFAKPKV